MRRFHPLITGTLLLTAVGFFCRILGFFYRIFLSRTIGAEGLGLYQMIFPIHGIAFALCAHYNPGIGADGANLAKNISRQLVALGLSDRGITIRNSGDGMPQ